MRTEGLCECGCRGETTVAKQTHRGRGHVKGQHLRFISGHNKKGALNPRWKGGRILQLGYVLIKSPDHPRANQGGYVREHILVAEEALGRPLPEGAVVHHVNEDPADNRPTNLVICQDQAYHKLLHQRMRAKAACGHADWRRCVYCKEYDDPENLYVYSSAYASHRECNNADQRQRRALKKEATPCELQS